MAKSWELEWPSRALSTRTFGKDAILFKNMGTAMMFKLKQQAQLTGNMVGKMVHQLANGTVVIAYTNHGHDRIEIVKPTERKKQLIPGGIEYLRLYLIFQNTDFRMFDLNLTTQQSRERGKVNQFWLDDNFYQGPWEADMVGDSGFGSGTASSINNFLSSSPRILLLNTINHSKWNIVLDNNIDLSGLFYFPVTVLVNVPGVSTHGQLGGGNCFDPLLCISAIIPSNNCATCYVTWWMHGILPVSYQSLQIPEYTYIPFLKNYNEEDADGNSLEYVEWEKKNQVWSRGAFSNTPRVDITGKTNYSISVTEKSKLNHSISYRESIYPISSRGENSETGDWWDTWNPALRIYQPCWVDIKRGFGGDETGWWPFWTWLHETPSTGIASYKAYANLIFGGNTRQAQGYGMHWLEYDPENPSDSPIQNSMDIVDLDETLGIANGACIHSQTTGYRSLGGCSYENGPTDSAYAGGVYSGKFFSPVATLGNKKFLYFENEISGSGNQSAFRFSGSYFYDSFPYPWCRDVGPCCTSIGFYCFGVCPDCVNAPTRITEGGQQIFQSGNANHSMGINQSLKIGRLDSGAIVDIITIVTGQHAYAHVLNVSSTTKSSVTSGYDKPYDHCRPPGDPSGSFCGCNYGGQSEPDSFTHSEEESYVRNITTYEVSEYASNPNNNDIAIVYKKIVINATSSTVNGYSETNWVHSGTRTVTWHIYVRSGEQSKTFNLTPTFTVTRSGGSEAGGQGGSGERVWAPSLQLNNDYLAFSYIEDKWANVGENFYSIIGQMIYPGPINLEDRKVEAYYNMGGEKVFDNVGVVFNKHKYHYGVISLRTGFPIFKKWEWEIDLVEEGGTVEKVYTVGLLIPDDETKQAYNDRTAFGKSGSWINEGCLECDQ